MVAALLLIDFILLITWQIVDPLRETTIDKAMEVMAIAIVSNFLRDSFTPDDLLLSKLNYAEAERGIIHVGYVV